MAKKDLNWLMAKKLKLPKQLLKINLSKKNLFNEFDYLDSSLWQIQLTGEEDVQGEPCYKIRASLVNGNVKNLYFSKKSFLLLREDEVEKAEQDKFSTMLFSGYKKYEGLTFYSKLQFGNTDKIQTAEIVELKLNDSISDKDFE